MGNALTLTNATLVDVGSGQDGLWLTESESGDHDSKGLSSLVARIAVQLRAAVKRLRAFLPSTRKLLDTLSLSTEVPCLRARSVCKPFGPLIKPIFARHIVPFALVAVFGSSQAQDDFVLIGTLGGSTSRAVAVNSNGQVAGISTTSTPGSTRAFLWTGGRLINLGSLGGNRSEANGINNNGQVVGASTTSSGRGHGFLWWAGSMTDLGTLGTSLSGDGSNAVAINDHAQVVGWSLVNSGASHAFLWEKGRMTDLGTLGGFQSFATGINNRGEIIGNSETPGDWRPHAFLWRAGQMTDLGPGEAVGINNRGQILLWSAATSRYLVLTNGNSVVLEPGFNASGINDSGDISGSFAGSDLRAHAAMWSGGRVIDFSGIGGGDSHAYAISKNGQMVGFRSASSSSPQVAVIWNGGPLLILSAMPASEEVSAETFFDRRQGNFVSTVSTASPAPAPCHSGLSLQAGTNYFSIPDKNGDAGTSSTNTLQRYLIICAVRPADVELKKISVSAEMDDGTIIEILKSEAIPVTTDPPSPPVYRVSDITILPSPPLDARFAGPVTFTELRVRQTLATGLPSTWQRPSCLVGACSLPRKLTYKVTIAGKNGAGKEVESNTFSISQTNGRPLRPIFRSSSVFLKGRYGSRDSGGDDWAAPGTMRWLTDNSDLVNAIDDISGEHGRDIGHLAHRTGSDIDTYHYVKMPGQPATANGMSNYIELTKRVIKLINGDMTNLADVQQYVVGTRDGIERLALNREVSQIIHGKGSPCIRAEKKDTGEPIDPGACSGFLPVGWLKELMLCGTVTTPIGTVVVDLGVGIWPAIKDVNISCSSKTGLWIGGAPITSKARLLQTCERTLNNKQVCADDGHVDHIHVTLNSSIIW